MGRDSVGDNSLQEMVETLKEVLDYDDEDIGSMSKEDIKTSYGRIMELVEGDVDEDDL